MIQPGWNLPRNRVGGRAATALLVLHLSAASAVASAGIIPSQRCRGLWIVPLVFDQKPQRTLHLVLDTGAGTTSVDPDSVVRILGRRVKTGKTITLRNGRTGPLNVRRLPAEIHEMDHLARAIGHPVDGILGFPAFHDVLLTLDYRRNEVRVGRGALGPPDGREIFEDLGKRRPYIGIDLDGERLPVLIDSGSTGGLELNEDDPVAWAVPPRPYGAAASYASEIVVESAGRMRGNVMLGPLRLERPVVEVSDRTRLVGATILRRFELTLDHRRRRIRLVPHNDRAMVFPPERGIGVAFRPIDEGFEVARLLEGSRAGEAGLREGDLVVAVDGVPVHENRCEESGDDPKKKRTILTVRRDGADRDLAVEIVVLVP